MTDSRLLDSSVWIDYFIKGSFKNIVERGILKISVLSLFEIKKKFLKNKSMEAAEIDKMISFVKERSLLIDTDGEISEKAAEISVEKGLGAIDALLYATAQLNDSVLLTLDNDFKGLNDVEILE